MYDAKQPFVGVAQVELLGDGVAFVHGALRADGQPLSVTQWRHLGRLLRDGYGIMKVQAERFDQDGKRSRRVEFDTLRA